MSHDPLSISNTVLDLASRRGIDLRCHELQRVVYFANGAHLMRTSLPLVSGCYEAWKTGPVHPIIYLAFGSAGRAPIKFRAARRREYGGVRAELPPIEEPRVVSMLARLLSPEDGIAPARLSRLARVENAPWHHVIAQVRARQSVSLRITNTCMIERFGLHKISAVGAEDDEAEPIDVPFSFAEFLTEASTFR